MINTLNGIAYVKFLKGTPSAYNNLSVKDQDTLYFVSEEGATVGALYLGNKLIDSSATMTGFRSQKESEWLAQNPILSAGEPGFAIDVYRLKIGDGVTPWKDLPWLTSGGGSSGVHNASSMAGFPEKGDVNVIYKSSTDKLLYQWNDTTQTYEMLVTGTVNLDGIEYIYGGNANG